MNKIYMLSETDEKLLKKIKSKNKTERLKIASNKETESDILCMLLDDTQKNIIEAVLMNPAIDETIFNKIIDPINYRELDKSLYFMFAMNSSFKKEWVEKFLDFLKNKPENVGLILKCLKTPQFFNNEDEWIQLYNIILKILNNWNHVTDQYWYYFFKFPSHSFSEKITLLILNNHGKDIKKIDARFTSIGKTLLTDAVKEKLYEITQDEIFLPQEVIDIFLF